MLTMNNFKSQYYSLFIGYFWILLYPLIQLLISYVVFSVFMKINVPYYEMFLLIGFIIWNFYADATTASISILKSKSSMVKGLPFNKMVLVFSAVFSSFITFLIQLLVYLLLMIVKGIAFSSTMFIFLLYMAELFLLILGTSFLVTAIFPKFRDLDKIWSLFIQVTFWLTPVIYPIDYVPNAWVAFYNLNPVARLINDSRQALIYNYIPSVRHLLITVLLCLLVFSFGLYLFMFFRKTMAEDL